MLKNYFKSTFRNLRLHPGYAFINLTGLAIGMACCLLIALYLQDELSFDDYHEKRDQIHRVVTDYTTNGVTNEQGYTQGLLAPLLEREIPEVVHATRLLGTSGIMAYEEHRFTEEALIVTDASILSIFSFPLLRGNPETALSNPNSIVLTAPLAQKYFGERDPLGEVLTFDNDRELTVTGIVAKPPAQSHFTFDGLISMATLDNENAPSWMFNEWLSTFVQTYVLLNDEAEATRVETKIAALVEREAGDMMRDAERWVDLYLEPLPQIYLTSERDGLGSSGNLTNLYLFAFIAGFILLIACINFMNLATARAMNRAREVGVRKSLGAARGQLVYQFLGEAIVMAAMALMVALGIAKLSLPVFNNLAGKEIAMATLLNPSAMIWLALLVAAVGFFAGFYPALVLSGFKPVTVLKGKAGSWSSGERLRKSLVVFQFAISVALIVATAVVYFQLEFMKHQQLGFQKEQVVLLSFNGDEQVQQHLESIKEAMRRQPGVLSVAASQTVPGGGLPQAGGGIQLADGSAQEMSVGLYMVDFDFVDLYDMELVAGRGFSKSFSGDSVAGIILNETAVKQMGLPAPEDALGLNANFWGKEGQVIGVSKDIHHYALQTTVAPMAMRIDGENLTMFSVRIEPENIPGTIAALRALWVERIPQRPFAYQFLDEMFDTQYRAEERFGRIFMVFTVLTMVIACLGLFGLTTFMIQHRTKEIGIRKVLGASTQSVLYLLSKDISRLVLIAIIVSAPIVYYAMNRWLEAFPYRIDIPWWLFISAGLSALLIAWLTVGLQSIKAASANPIDALKYE